MVARRDDHHGESRFASVFGMALQKGREAVQAVQDAFAVIEAVYREDQLAVAEKPAVFFDRVAYLYFRRGLMVKVVIDSHWKRVHPGRTAAQLRLVQPELHVQNVLRGADEVAHVVGRMECDEIGSQQSPQKPGPLRQDAEQFVGGERDMMEISDA